jgi:hypothetical protein
MVHWTNLVNCTLVTVTCQVAKLDEVLPYISQLSVQF